MAINRVCDKLSLAYGSGNTMGTPRPKPPRVRPRKVGWQVILLDSGHQQVEQQRSGHMQRVQRQTQGVKPVNHLDQAVPTKV